MVGKIVERRGILGPCRAGSSRLDGRDLGRGEGGPGTEGARGAAGGPLANWEVVMERRGFLGLLAAIGLVKLPQREQMVVEATLRGCTFKECGCCRGGDLEAARCPATPRLQEGAAFSNINAELLRAYPPGGFAEAVERESVFRRRLRRGF